MAQQLDSVLNSMKKALNIPLSVESFDAELILHINGIFSKLQQIGVLSSHTFSIDDENDTWSDFMNGILLPEGLEDDRDALNMVRTYMYLELRLVFDPPSASLLTAMEKKRDELEWRLKVAGDLPVCREEIQNEDD